MQCKGWRGNFSWDGRRNVNILISSHLGEMYLSYITKCICINLQNIFVCNDMQCNLSSDGRRNVKNFNILPPLGEMHQEFFYKFKEKFQNQWSMQGRRIIERYMSELENISWFYFFQILFPPPQPTRGGGYLFILALFCLQTSFWPESETPKEK